MHLSRRRYRREGKPRWAYWGNDPAPTLMEPMHFGPYRVGPYDQMMAAAPMELRDARISKYGRKENCSSYTHTDSTLECFGLFLYVQCFS